MRKAFDDIIGNDRLRERLCRDIAEGALSHAYVLEGARGTGKHMLALRLAAAIACENRNDASHPPVLSRLPQDPLGQLARRDLRNARR